MCDKNKPTYGAFVNIEDLVVKQNQTCSEDKSNIGQEVCTYINSGTAGQQGPCNGWLYPTGTPLNEWPIDQGPYYTYDPNNPTGWSPPPPHGANDIYIIYDWILFGGLWYPVNRYGWQIGRPSEASPGPTLNNLPSLNLPPQCLGRWKPPINRGGRGGGAGRQNGSTGFNYFDDPIIFDEDYNIGLYSPPITPNSNNNPTPNSNNTPNNSPLADNEGPGGGCFIKGTLVSTAKGLLTIEQVKQGDSVYGYNFESQTVTLDKVEKVFESEQDKFVILCFGTEKIECTSGHRFYTGEWVAASKLKPRDAVMNMKGKWIELTEVLHQIKVQQVINFRVSNNHNYFVGSNAFLVHNDKEIYESDDDMDDDDYGGAGPATKCLA